MKASNQNGRLSVYRGKSFLLTILWVCSWSTCQPNVMLSSETWLNAQRYFDTALASVPIIRSQLIKCPLSADIHVSILSETFFFLSAHFRCIFVQGQAGICLYSWEARIWPRGWVSGANAANVKLWLHFTRSVCLSTTNVQSVRPFGAHKSAFWWHVIVLAEASLQWIGPLLSQLCFCELPLKIQWAVAAKTIYLLDRRGRHTRKNERWVNQPARGKMRNKTAYKQAMQVEWNGDTLIM